MCDSVHSIPQYTVAINESVEITSFAYNWPIPHDHQVYSGCKHSISTSGQIKELLNAIEKSMICEGLPDDSTVKSVAIDPNTDTTVPIPRTVIRHSIPHVPSPKQFKATVFYRSKDCNVLLPETSKCCDPCNKLAKQLKKKSKGTTFCMWTCKIESYCCGSKAWEQDAWGTTGRIAAKDCWTWSKCWPIPWRWYFKNNECTKFRSHSAHEILLARTS